MHGESSPPVLETRDLSKSFGPVRALDEVSITVQAGCTGLLGPNGAGKSTFIKLVLGLLEPDHGEARIEGIDTARDPLAVRSIVGYMPEHDCLPGDWIAQDFVRHMAELHGLPRKVAVQRASDTLFHVGLGEERYRQIGGFSTGMKQRVKLAQALAHDPRLMFLDEPTNGLDPEGRDEMLALAGRITHEMGINVVLSSHLLADIEKIADSVVILNGGRVVRQGTLRSLISATPTIMVRVHRDPAALAAALRARGESVAVNDTDVQVEHRSDATYDAIRDAAAESDTGIVYLKQRVLSLEDVYLASQSPQAIEAAGDAG